MATYQELMQQAHALLAQAEQMRAQERADAVRDARAQIAAYGLTAEDLGLGGAGTGAGGTRTPRASVRKAANKQFRGPNGQLWSGRGRQPAWIVSALAAGKSLDDFRV